MITVIDNYNEGSLEMYEGMSLSEAAGQFVLETSNLVNDFMTDLLLTEHAYLYENGQEIEYETLGEANENGLGFMDKVKNLIENAKTLILKIVNNIIAFITEKSTQFVSFFKKAGKTESEMNKAFAAYADKEVSTLKLFSMPPTAITTAFNIVLNFIDKQNLDGVDQDSLFTKAGEALESPQIANLLEEEKLGIADIQDCVVSTIFHSNKTIAEVKKQYKLATASLERFKKVVASKKSMDADSINEKLSLIRACIMHNTYVMRDAAKFYSIVMKSAFIVAKEVAGFKKDDDAEKKANEKAEKAEKKAQAKAAKNDKQEEVHESATLKRYNFLVK